MIAPHQDDEALGCGGLIATRQREGSAVHVVYITDGAGSHPEHPVVTPPQLAALRQAEARAALAILGVPPAQAHFIGAPDGRLPTLTATERERVVEALTRILSGLSPAQVFVPYRFDGSSEHSAAFGLIRQARDRAGSHIPCYEYPVWAWWNPRLLQRAVFGGGRVYRHGVGVEVARKSAALRAYRSQVEPLKPDTTAVLTPDFIAAFHGPAEYFFAD